MDFTLETVTYTDVVPCSLQAAEIVDDSENAYIDYTTSSNESMIVNEFLNDGDCEFSRIIAVIDKECCSLPRDSFGSKHCIMCDNKTDLLEQIRLHHCALSKNRNDFLYNLSALKKTYQPKIKVWRDTSSEVRT